MVIYLTKTTIDHFINITLSKVFENVIINRLEEYLWTSDNQFGYKSGHSTDLCVYALTEFIKYFKSRSTSVCVAFLDASKAFDKINHWVLFKKLIARRVPIYLVKVLYYWYQNQQCMLNGDQQCQVNFMLQTVFVTVVYYLLFYLMCISMILVSA